MEIESGKEICGSCKEWKGKRECAGGKIVVKSSARGLCQRTQKTKMPQGSCDFWQKWEEEKNDR
jgi:hypothetical protein